MDLQTAIALSLKVIADWRSIFIAIAVLLLWAALRYVGSVYHIRSRRRSRLFVPGSGKPSLAGKKAVARKGAAETPGEGMIE
jgi:hypothetical protein